jgi:hypothetical protein
MWLLFRGEMKQITRAQNTEENNLNGAAKAARRFFAGVKVATKND